ncbi:ChrR family anti-sigma-E factor [Marinomonas ostreistagni]|uniref:Cupin domain-containing protein n=1 Tax=Marinomonas ostreistagni TaxID=359209 RepID=A0ABS0ZBB7_9GAMM|nr:ChrR family anti-sigma-E factor [Marinomonas ostreistagni]MBJ7550954.1 cupin domain-containing protein [Marinomonas ostreistagni]
MLSCHPTIDILTEYAAGSLPLAHSLGVSVHLDQCPHCRDQVRRLNNIGAELFSEHSAEVRPDHMASLKSKVMASLVNHEETQAAVDDNTAFQHIPRSLRRWIPQGFNDLNWMPLTPSFKLATLSNESGGAQIALSRVKPGARLPNHTHTGNEITVVLKGAFSDDEGLYREGDFICRDHNHKHQPRVTKDAECICLIILDSPIEFTGWFTRLLNPIMRYFHPNSAAT